MKGRQTAVSSANTYSVKQANKLLLRKVSLMLLRAERHYPIGKWSHYRQVRPRPKNQSKKIWSGYRTGRTSYCSSITMMQAVRRRRKRQAYYHLARSRSLTSKAIRTLQTPLRTITCRRLEKLFGMLSHTDLTGLSMASLYFHL